MGFALVNSGLTGPAITGVSGSGASYVVTAATGTGAGTLALRVPSPGAIKDLAGNPLSGTPFVGQAYVIDRIVPTKPVFSQVPPDPSATSTSTFVWSASDSPPSSGLMFECSKKNGAFQACASPLTYVVVVTNNGLHQFAVRAIDGAGNVSAVASYSWKVAKGSPQVYTIAGTASGLLYPTNAVTGVPINLTFQNPNSDTVLVNSLTVAIASVSAPNATPTRPCTVADFAVTQFTGAYGFQVAVGTSSLQSLGFAQATWPTIRLVNRNANQDGCKGATVNLAYGGAS
jgi:hypothetical protein